MCVSLNQILRSISGKSLLRRLVYPFIMKKKEKLNKRNKIKYQISMINKSVMNLLD